MPTPLLELRALRKLYGTQIAVAEVWLALAAGQFLSLLGPSGSGKTTTLSMIAGLLEPSGGEILLDGRPLTPLPPYRRNIGMVFQNYALFPHMNVARNIAFPLEMRRMPRAQIGERVGRVLGLVGLADYGARYPHQLSGGQQQRIALARALVFEPPLLLMDEPLGALDKKLRAQMQIEIKQLHRQLGMAIVYVTHDQEEALAMSDRIAVFNDGRIEQIGTPAELYDRPATRFVADFIGESNLFRGTVTDTADGYCRIETDGLKLRARAGERIGPGQAAWVAVRPERMRVAKPGLAPADRENRLIGDVAELIFLGRARKYVIRACGRDLTVEQPLEAGGESAFAIGEPICIEWRAEDAVAVPDP